MSKKYKNKTCVYCAEKISTTADHIFAREFFLLNERENLPKVPSCKHCNEEKSDLEHYLTAVLPFGGRHENAKENLSSMVLKRLNKNQSLHRELQEKRSHALSVEPEGDNTKCMVLPIEGQKFLDLFKFITKGLVWYHWKTLIDNNFDVKTISLTQYGEEFFQQKFFSLNSKQKVDMKVGNNTFSYTGMQGVDLPQITVWQFNVYNGLKVTESRADFAEASTKIGALTGPKILISKIQEL